jgi:tetratricopeptide (TPR) repeat protein
LWAAAGIISCGSPHVSPQAAFDHARMAFLHGDVEQSQKEASHGYSEYQASNSDWAWKFLILEAKAALDRGLFTQVLELLKSRPLPAGQSDLTVSVLTLEGVANVHLRNLSEAQSLLNEAQKVCGASSTASCGDVLQARGVLADEQDQLASAENLYQLSLAFARTHHDSFLESTSLLNLGNESLNQGRFDEAIDRSEAGYRVAKTADAKVPELVMLGNIGWAYYRLGDSEKALELLTESENAAAQAGDFFEEENSLTDIGYIYMDARKFDLAGRSFQTALQIAEGIKAQQDIYNVLRVLARLSLQTGDADGAGRYAQQALSMARENGNHTEELYPQLVQGQKR